MSNAVVVVLVVGVAILASLFARKRGFTNNQRIVLSGVAIGLLIFTYSDGQPGKIVLVVAAIIILAAAVGYLRKSGQ